MLISGLRRLLPLGILCILVSGRLSASEFSAAEKREMLEQESRIFDRQVLPDCAGAPAGSDRLLKGVLEKYLQLRCLASGHVLVARPGYYVEMCLVDCGPQVALLSAARNPYRPLSAGVSGAYFTSIDSSPVDEADRSRLKYRGEAGRSATSLTSKFLELTNGASLYRVTLDGGDKDQNKMIVFEERNSQNKLRGFFLKNDNEVLPISFSVKPVGELQDNARNHPSAGK